ncbi:MAG: polymer-forming cytoskeletal protein [Tissierellales bacterium]|jgi:cytoskeletal protein CcmA (bactofilin family)|nr:polymer-forming cytoskeletal protein [Tissierellales bacterium]
MFGTKKTEEEHEVLDTIIGEKTVITGKIEAKGNLRIDGSIVGDLNIDGDVTIGYSGKIKGQVICNNLIIAGCLEGNIIAKEQLRIASSGKLIGDINVKSFVVDEDAIFIGKSIMKDSAKLKLEASKKIESPKRAKAAESI